MKSNTWNPLFFYILLPVVFICTFWRPSFSADLADTVKKTPEPEWVDILAVKKPDRVPHQKIRDGEYYLLVDKQVKATGDSASQYYEHFAIHVVNETGLTANSSISIDFAPGYQTLDLHQLNIYRNGKKLPRLDDTKVELMRREKRMESLIYDGTYTANLIIDDVRKGDVIEYAYTITGDNPIFDGIFSYWLPVSWSVPVKRFNFVMHWPKNKPFFQKSVRTDLTLTRIRQSSGDTYFLQQSDVAPVDYNTQTPAWYQSFGKIQISQLNRWEDVVNWAVPLYREAYEKKPGVSRIAERIKNTYKDKNDQIMAALTYTQKEIRYLGLEIGKDSHKPSSPDETIQRLYGDCKDKSVVLIALLSELGVSAAPALVHTYMQHTIKDFCPSERLFDHVIVRARHNEKDFWLDPTRIYQGDSLEKVFQPDYGLALVIEPGQHSLTPMPENRKQALIEIQEVFDLRQGTDQPVEYKIRTVNHGRNAEISRYDIAEQSLSQLQENYIDFYAKYYPGIRVASPMSSTDDKKENRFMLSEHYWIDNFWKKDEADNSFQSNFTAWGMNGYLRKPKQLNRVGPFFIQHPVNIIQQTTILLPESFDIEESEYTENNPYYYLRADIRYNDTTHTVELMYQYNTYRDAVMPDQIAGFVKTIETSNDKLDFYLSTPVPGTATPAPDPPDQETAGAQSPESNDWIFLIIVGLLMLAFAYILLEWLADIRKSSSGKPEVYYPVSLFKLVLLSVFTLNLYQIYWFYKNWKAIRKRDDSHIMPFWRSVFFFLWFIPLTRDLKEDSIKRLDKNILPNGYAVAGFYILYLFLTICFFSDSLAVYFGVLSVLCILPFANYIRYVNRENTEAIRFNSRWRPRHVLLGVITAIYLGGAIAAELYVIPDSKIVPGTRLKERDIRFLQRKGLVKDRKDLLYFYSNALISIRNDGNGATRNLLFSYWKDEETNKFEMEKAPYSRIKKIEVSWADQTEEITTIRVIEKDGSEFILYASPEKELDKQMVEAIQRHIKK